MLGRADAPQFDVEVLSAKDAIAKYRPAVVLSAWMTAGEDWTPEFRAAGVEEYVLIGELQPASYECCYSLNREHPGYSRTLLKDVSAEMLSAFDGTREARGEDVTNACTVAFRRDAGMHGAL